MLPSTIDVVRRSCPPAFQCRESRAKFFRHHVSESRAWRRLGFSLTWCRKGAATGLTRSDLVPTPNVSLPRHHVSESQAGGDWFSPTWCRRSRLNLAILAIRPLLRTVGNSTFHPRHLGRLSAGPDTYALCNKFLTNFWSRVTLPKCLSYVVGRTRRASSTLTAWRRRIH